MEGSKGVSSKADTWLVERFGEEITVEGNCEKHGHWSKTARSKTPENLMKKCQKCIDDAAAENAEADRIAKEAAAESRRLEHLEAIGVSRRHDGKTFDTFIADNPEKARALSVCRKFSEQVVKNPVGVPSLILSGSPGTGKTHLACAIAQYADLHGIGVVKRNAADVFRAIKATWAKDSAKSERALLEDTGSRDLLIIDEVGTQHGTDTERLMMFEVVNRRYENCLPTILVSNLNIDRLREEIGDRVLDRLREGGGQVLLFTGESWRKQ